MKNKPFTLAGNITNPGEHKTIEWSAAALYSQTKLNTPIHVINGKERGPRVFVMAAIHGDEINGVEIIRRLLRQPYLKKIHGTLIIIPVANMYGFMTLSRYLPDQRDLNRSFPGSKSGSLAARIAHMYKEEILSQCTHGIDLHTGNIHSENFPHIRANLDVPGALKMARAFDVPVIINAKLLDGSLRQAATELQIPVLTYEGGEALRFNEVAIRVGLRGILNVLHVLGVITLPKSKLKKRIKSKIANASSWVRSPISGILHPFDTLGNDVDEGEKLGVIGNPFEAKETEILAHVEGVIIGRNTLPLVNEGDPLFHIAKIKGAEDMTHELNILKHDSVDNPDLS
ncbi:MAG: succinylglutamate desuccinylase/aspartoacylase family protein [Gammaproteobacteria bacterium]